MEEMAERTVSTLKEAVEVEDMVRGELLRRGGRRTRLSLGLGRIEVRPDQVDEIVRILRLEALSHAVHEEQQEESVHATVRVCDDMLDIAVPTNETTGVAFALDTDGHHSIEAMIDTVERILPEAASTTARSDAGTVRPERFRSGTPSPTTDGDQHLNPRPPC
ncbi:MAG: hypothetical protein ABEH78_06535 [Haloferacaceae archaeon]